MLGVCSGSSSGDQPALAGYADRTPGRAELGLHLGLGHAAVRSLDEAVQGLAAAPAAAPRPAAGREGAARRLGRLGGGGIGQRWRHLLASRLPALAAAQRAPLLAELAAPGYQQHEDEEALQGAEQREHVLEGQAGVGDGQVAEEPSQTWQSTKMDISAIWFRLVSMLLYVQSPHGLLGTGRGCKVEYRRSTSSLTRLLNSRQSGHSIQALP